MSTNQFEQIISKFIDDIPAGQVMVVSSSVYGSILLLIVDLSPTFYCLPKPFLVYGSMLLLSTLILSSCSILKKNQNAPRPSEHPPVMGEKCQNV